MDNKICPSCNEENPAEAVMCWYCYQPLTVGAKASRPVAVQASDESAGGPTFDLENLTLGLSLASLVGSGWLKGRTRYLALGGGLALMGSFLLAQVLNMRANARHMSEVRNEVDPIARIASTILFYGALDEAQQIRITRRSKGASVEYLVAEEWRDQMRLPDYVWQSLKAEFEIRASEGAIDFDSAQDCTLIDEQDRRGKGKFRLRMVVEPPHEEILLTRL